MWKSWVYEISGFGCCIELVTWKLIRDEKVSRGRKLVGICTRTSMCYCGRKRSKEGEKNQETGPAQPFKSLSLTLKAGIMIAATGFWRWIIFDLKLILLLSISSTYKYVYLCCPNHSGENVYTMQSSTTFWGLVQLARLYSSTCEVVVMKSEKKVWFAGRWTRLSTKYEGQVDMESVYCVWNVIQAVLWAVSGMIMC